MWFQAGACGNRVPWLWLTITRFWGWTERPQLSRLRRRIGALQNSTIQTRTNQQEPRRNLRQLQLPTRSCQTLINAEPMIYSKQQIMRHNRGQSNTSGMDQISPHRQRGKDSGSQIRKKKMHPVQQDGHDSEDPTNPVRVVLPNFVISSPVHFSLIFLISVISLKVRDSPEHQERLLVLRRAAGSSTSQRRHFLLGLPHQKYQNGTMIFLRRVFLILSESLMNFLRVAVYVACLKLLQTHSGIQVRLWRGMTAVETKNGLTSLVERKLIQKKQGLSQLLTRCGIGQFPCSRTSLPGIPPELQEKVSMCFTQ